MTGLYQSPQLDAMRRKFYEMAGGSYDSGKVEFARMTTEQRTVFFRTPEFRDWVAYELSQGRKVYWLKDIDKTQAAGDAFTFFLEKRWREGWFTPTQLAIVDRFLLSKEPRHTQLFVEATRRSFGLLGRAGLNVSLPRFAQMRTPVDGLKRWLNKVDGGEGLGLLDVWDEIYWKSQFGMTLAEKTRQVEAFAPEYAARVFPGVAEENKALEEAGVIVICLSNGDEELAKAIAPYLGIKPENVAGSHLILDDQGCACNVEHLYQTYEITSAEWQKRPQPGKFYKFHWWLNHNKERLGLTDLDPTKIVVAGCDGDSASSDGGMMVCFDLVAVGYFMVYDNDERLQAFIDLAYRYGWMKGQFCTLYQRPSPKDFRPPV